ncbi:MAG: hypothetical protein Q9219_007210 [cf. Caloplaca sp. 3 TL-2023]
MEPGLTVQLSDPHFFRTLIRHLQQLLDAGVYSREPVRYQREPKGDVGSKNHGGPMAPGAGGKRKRGDRNYSYDGGHENQRPSPHRPSNLGLAQHSNSQHHPQQPHFGQDQNEQRGGGRRRGSRGGRGGVSQRSPITSPSTMYGQPRSFNGPPAATSEPTIQAQPPIEPSPAPQKDTPQITNNIATQTTDQTIPEPQIYFYDYVNDTQKDNWVDSGRAEVVATGRKACKEENRTVLSLIFQDLVRAGLDGRISAEEAGSVVKDILEDPPDQAIVPESTRRFQPDKIFLDVLSVCAEAWNTNTSLKPIVFATGISAQLMRLILDSSLLEGLGLIRSTFVRVGIRQQTNLLYRQSNYNLLREETEGYSKLVTELFTTSSGESLSSEVVEETFERVKGMIGAFDLDVGRVLDVTLDVFAAVLVKQYRFFVKYLRVSSWWPQDRSSEDRTAHGLGTLPKWALPGAAGRPMSEEEKAVMTAARDERDKEFWQRVKDIGMKAFFEIGNRRAAPTELTQALDVTAAAADPMVASEDRKWMEVTSTLPPIGNKVAAQILGFKLKFYSSSARDVSDVLPVNIIYLAALLIKIGFISLRDLYPHLWPSEDAMSDVRDAKMKENIEKERLSRPGANMPNALASAGVLTDDSIDPRRARELAKKRELEAAKLAAAKAEAEAASAATGAPVEELDELPEPAEQKVQLLKSLLCIGALPESLYMLGRFPWLPDVFMELPEHLHRILHHCVNKVYEPLRPLKDRTELREQSRILEGDQPIPAKGGLRYVDAPPRKVMRWAQLDKDDTNEGIDYKFYWDDWADSIPVCQTVDDVFLLCSTLLNFTGVKLGQDSTLLVKFCRIGRHSLDTDRSEHNRTRWVDLSKRLLLPALSLTKSNAGVANEVYELIKGFSLHTRYSMYAEWFQGQTSRLPDIKAALDRARLETRDVLKRISKSNLKSMARALAKIAYSSPGAVFLLAISQIEIYENFAETFTECARYLTYLAYDVFNWALLSAVGGGGKSRVQADGMLTSHWLQSLTVFISKVYKRYSVMSPVPMLQYVLDQLTRGNSVDLIVLEEMVTTMAGIVSDTNFNDNQVDAMAGGDLLQAQTMLQLLDRRHESRSTAKRLMRCLAEPKLAGQLLVAIAQERENCVYKLPDKDAPAKLLGNLFDEVHRVLTQYLEFMRTNLSVTEFNLLVPDVSSLIVDFGLEPGIAFWISRASIWAAMAEYDSSHPSSAVGAKQSPVKEQLGIESLKADSRAQEEVQSSKGQDQASDKTGQDEAMSLCGDTNGKVEPEKPDVETKDIDQADSAQLASSLLTDTVQTQQPWHPVLRKIMESLRPSSPAAQWDRLSISFYVTFWQLSLRDMQVPAKGYEDEQTRLRNKITAINSDRSDISIAGTQRKEREKKGLSDLIDRLVSEHKERITAFTRTRSRLQKEKTGWFADVGSRWDELNAAILEQCFFPRVRMSSVDALYGFKMFKYLHSSGTTNFRTLRFLDHLFKEKQLENMIFLCSAKEAEHLGRFLREILKDLGRWHTDKAIFEKEAFGFKKDLKGFVMKVGADKSNDVLMDYEDFRRILNKWHRNINNALKTCFGSGEYMHIRNAINVSKAIVEQFPMVDWMGKQQAEAIERVMKSELKRADLNLAAASLLGNLRRREKEWVMPQAFNLVSNTDLRSHVASAQQIQSRHEHGINGANIARSGSAKPGTPQPDAEGSKPLNPKAPAFEPETQSSKVNGISKPSKSGHPDAEDGEIEDAKMTGMNLSPSSSTTVALPADQGALKEANGPPPAALEAKSEEKQSQAQEPYDHLISQAIPQQPVVVQDKQAPQTEQPVSKPAENQSPIPPRPEIIRPSPSPSANGRLQHTLPDRPDPPTSRPAPFRTPEHDRNRPPRNFEREQRFSSGPQDDYRNRILNRDSTGQQSRAHESPHGKVLVHDRDQVDHSIPNKRARLDYEDRHDMPSRSDARPYGEMQHPSTRDKHFAEPNPIKDGSRESAMPPPRSNIPQHPDRAAMIHGNRSSDRPHVNNQYPEPPQHNDYSPSDRLSRGTSPVRSEDRRPVRAESRRDLRQDDRPAAGDRRVFSDTLYSNQSRYDDSHPPAGPRTDRPISLGQGGANDRFHDALRPSAGSRAAVDMNHGRLNQDSSYNGQRSDQYGRLNAGLEAPSGPRMPNGNVPPGRSLRNASAPQPNIDSRPLQQPNNNAPPQSPNSEKQAPTGPAFNRGPSRQNAPSSRQDAGNTSTPPTPATESQDTAGIHPDRLKALQDLHNPNSIQVQGSRPPIRQQLPSSQPPPAVVPRGPSSQQTPPSPVGPSPTNRGPPTGPGRSDKRFAGIQGVLQQANPPNGSDRGGQGTSIRGRGGRPNAVNTHSSSNSGPTTPSTQRPDQFQPRQDLFANRVTGQAASQQYPGNDDGSYIRNGRRGPPRDGGRDDLRDNGRDGMRDGGRDRDVGRDNNTNSGYNVRDEDRRSTRPRSTRSPERDHGPHSARDNYDYDSRHPHPHPHPPPPRRDEGSRDLRARIGPPPASTVSGNNNNDLAHRDSAPRRSGGPPRSEAELALPHPPLPPPLSSSMSARERRGGPGPGPGPLPHPPPQQQQHDYRDQDWGRERRDGGGGGGGGRKRGRPLGDEGIGGGIGGGMGMGMGGGEKRVRR